MSSFPGFKLHSWWGVVVALEFLVVQAMGLNTDGVVLLSFRFLILSDPLNVLQSWNLVDQSPCSWNGVACDSIDGYLRVTCLSLPNSQLLGSIPSDLGRLQHLQKLDFSNNSLNGSLPVSLFNSTKLRFLDLSNNLISGGIPETIGTLQNLQFLNLSDNGLSGTLPATLTTIQNLTVIALKNNYFSGNLPSGFQSVQVLDLSSNLVEGSLPPNFGGNHINYLNFSFNRLSGEIPPEFAEKIPGNATIDLSFNNLTGEIPDSAVFNNRKPESFSGNPFLCGKVTKRDCPIPSPTSPPAMAAIPKTPNTGSKKSQQNKFKPVTIVAIIVGDIAGIVLVIVVFFVIYKIKTKKKMVLDNRSSTSPWMELRGFSRWSCLRKRGEYEEESDTEEEECSQRQEEQEHDKKGKLVTVDGEKKLDLDTLLKASAYILGSTGSNIMYKAVLEDGSSLAVRRIGENSVSRLKDFENQVRAIAKLVHPNLVRVRGFYWGVDEKLIIYDFVPNGSLASARYIRKVGSSPCHLPWETRLKIAKGMARGLAYLHEKKHVHANLKPNNILLDSNMEPKIGDFGLERLVTGDTSSKIGMSVRNFGSKRSTASRDSFQELLGPSPSPSPSSFGVSPYLAPESLRSIKPNPKWDVYAFGVILLELLTGKVVVVDELGKGNGVIVEDQNKALRMADAAIRGELEGKEDALLACFKLGYNCASPIPQKRPTMKEALQILDKIPPSSNHYGY
ncbi:putative LRR receptor-like serine/threonine-protein kinase [Hibiscus syriacus]|uniref:non-specific serine/threonine protein kinase n=1 Tax=Hibiscus syriacus TaxID=106335 RepID=A0A6A3A9T0_HIBSY|nr:probable LRR receptor-like serine/threonine-protein kinase At4g37250 [Hibiscus syriacus]KAE8701190.1 putative LRR receptor-like serine/threonine-protein kinase [Hibiscus syriacus]